MSLLIVQVAKNNTFHSLPKIRNILLFECSFLFFFFFFSFHPSNQNDIIIISIILIFYDLVTIYCFPRFSPFLPDLIQRHICMAILQNTFYGIICIMLLNVKHLRQKIVRIKCAMEDITSNRNKIKTNAIKFDIQHYFIVHFKTQITKHD